MNKKTKTGKADLWRALICSLGCLRICRLSIHTSTTQQHNNTTNQTIWNNMKQKTNNKHTKTNHEQIWRDPDSRAIRRLARGVQGERNRICVWTSKWNKQINKLNEQQTRKYFARLSCCWPGLQRDATQNPCTRQLADNRWCTRAQNHDGPANRRCWASTCRTQPDRTACNGAANKKKHWKNIENNFLLPVWPPSKNQCDRLDKRALSRLLPTQLSRRHILARLQTRRPLLSS